MDPWICSSHYWKWKLKRSRAHTHIFPRNTQTEWYIVLDYILWNILFFFPIFSSFQLFSTSIFFLLLVSTSVSRISVSSSINFEFFYTRKTWIMFSEFHFSTFLFLLWKWYSKSGRMCWCKNTKKIELYDNQTREKEITTEELILTAHVKRFLECSDF